MWQSTYLFSLCAAPVYDKRLWMQMVLATRWARLIRHSLRCSRDVMHLLHSLLQTRLSARPQRWQPVLSGRKEQGRPHSKRKHILSLTIISLLVCEVNRSLPYSTEECVLSPHACAQVMLTVMRPHSEVAWLALPKSRRRVFFSNVHSFTLIKQKLPFTIPELVQASPCRSSDGVLYMGKANSQIGIIVWLLIQHIIR